MTNREMLSAILVTVIILSGFNFVFTWMEKASRGYDARLDTEMNSCQSSGKVYGECYNVIHQRQTIKFDQ